MVGVEIGPFFNPVAPKAAGWRTTTIDFQDGDKLREVAKNHDAEVIRNMAGAIEDVDIVWTGEPLDEVTLKKTPGGYDYIVASHVIEHTPDILGFLQQCSRLLKKDGIISLAVPDMRKCFDLLKTPTNRREILAAHREQRIRHTPETLFEARSWATTRNGQGSWIAGTRAPIEITNSYNYAIESYHVDAKNAKHVLPYVDAHAWYFTPASFELAILELNEMGLLNYRIDWIEENIGSEFIVQMKRAEARSAMPADVFMAERIRLSLKHHFEFMHELGFDVLEKPHDRIHDEAAPVASLLPERNALKEWLGRFRRALA